MSGGNKKPFIGENMSEALLEELIQVEKEEVQT